MTVPISFADTPTLTGANVVLRPLGPEHVEDLLAALTDVEMLRLTGTHAVFDRDQIVEHCATRVEQHDRLDYAILDRATGAFLGDLAINDLDEGNRSCGFRIALRSGVAGRGYGSEATLLWDGRWVDADLMSLLSTDPR